MDTAPRRRRRGSKGPADPGATLGWWHGRFHYRMAIAGEAAHLCGEEANVNIGFRTLRLVLAACMLLAGVVGLSAQAPERGDQPLVLYAEAEGAIGPATTRHIENVLEAARERNADAVVLRLSTPGGLATSMRDIVKEILASPVPVIGWVAPSGTHAASAGTYILYSTHLAAMARGTNIGAATPIQIGGGGLPGLPSEEERDREEENGNDRTPDDPAAAKAVHDAVAFIRGLAEMHDRNADWAEKAVREAVSIGAREALELGVIEVVADDLDSLLEQAHGREVNVAGETRTLETEDAVVEDVEPGFMTRVLAVLSNPNVAFILLMIGVYGLIFEFLNPGTIGPGVIGAICLLLALYALNQLPLNYAAAGLMLAGVAFMVAEALSPTFGILGMGGIAAFVLGAAMLIDTDVPEFQISWWAIGGTAAASGGMLILLLGYLWRVYRVPRRRDRVPVIGADGEVLEWEGDRGYVWAQGERWRARGPADLEPGQHVHVRDLDGLVVVVDREAETPGSESVPRARG